MKYIGKELEAFDKAKFWRGYIHFLVKKYLGKNVLEVGAGIGSFTKIYKDKTKNITLTEVDPYNHKTLVSKFKNIKKINVFKKYTSKIKGKYDTLLHLNVLEHIKNDKKELDNCLKLISSKGFIIILVPAHQKLFSKFDKAVGHFRRYNKKFFVNYKNNKIKSKKIFYLDSCGMILYFLNSFFKSNEIYPSKFKIFIWDKIFTPITFFLDYFLFYKVGKNILCIIEKK